MDDTNLPPLILFSLFFNMKYSSFQELEYYFGTKWILVGRKTEPFTSHDTWYRHVTYHIDSMTDNHFWTFWSRIQFNHCFILIFEWWSSPDVAYFLLPQFIFNRWNSFLVLWSAFPPVVMKGESPMTISPDIPKQYSSVLRNPSHLYNF